MKQREFHFFTSSSRNWTTHSSLRECIRLQEKFDKQCGDFQPKGYRIWKVLVPQDTAYGIDNYRPDLEPEKLILIDLVLYKQYKSGNTMKIKPATGDDAVDG